MTMTSATICSVCGEALTPQTQAFCNSCAQPYHLNQRQDIPGKDCGQVWINEEHMALEFGCDRCLHPEKYDNSLEDILDLSEAALYIGISETMLAEAADRGEIVHRKTSSGVYLFQRKHLPQPGRQ